MSDAGDTPKKQLEVSGSGTGGRKRTAVGAGDGGEGEGPKEFPGSSDYSMFMTNPRVVFCERHELVRAGMKAMIPFCRVIGEATGGTQAWDLVRCLKPELLITEIDIDEIDGVELCRRVHESFPHTVILISTHSFNATKIYHRVMRSGANGIYLKRTGRSEFVRAVVETLNGWHYCDENVSKLINQHPSQINSLDEGLTEREIDVLIRLDLCNAEIADELGIEQKRVEKVIISILKKLNVETRYLAAQKAVKLGFVLLPVMSSRNNITGTTEDEEMTWAHAEAALKDSR